MPRPRRPPRASLDEIHIVREGNDALIEYADPGVEQARFTLGRERLATLTDAEILELWNQHVEARDRLIADYQHVALEVPFGKPQLRYEKNSEQWVPRGDVVKGVVMGADGTDLDEEFVTIDGRDLTLREFARMMMTYAGWGFRLLFVPDDKIHEQATVDVREPPSEA